MKYFFLILLGATLLSILLDNIKHTSRNWVEVNTSFLPFESKIIDKSTDNQLSFFLPKKGFSLKLFVIFFFTIFWFYVVTIWTFAAVYFFPYLVIISIPFWFIGLKWISFILKILLEEQEISLNKDYLIIIRKKIKTKSLKIKRADIIKIFFSEAANKWYVYYKTLQKGETVMKKEFFFEFIDKEKAKWLVTKLNAYK